MLSNCLAQFRKTACFNKQSNSRVVICNNYNGQRLYTRRTNEDEWMDEGRKRRSKPQRVFRHNEKNIPKQRKGWYVRPDEEIGHIESSVYDINELGIKRGRTDGIMDGYFVSSDIPPVIKPGFSYRLNVANIWKLDYVEEDRQVIREASRGIVRLSMKRQIKEANDKLLVLIRSYSPLGYQFHNIKSNISLFCLLAQYFLEQDSEDAWINVVTHYFYLSGSYRFLTLGDIVNRLISLYTKLDLKEGLEDVLRVIDANDLSYSNDIFYNLIHYYLRHRNVDDLSKLVGMILNGFPFVDNDMLNSLFTYFNGSQLEKYQIIALKLYVFIPEPEPAVTDIYNLLLKKYPQPKKRKPKAARIIEYFTEDDADEYLLAHALDN